MEIPCKYALKDGTKVVDWILQLDFFSIRLFLI